MNFQQLKFAHVISESDIFIEEIYANLIFYC